MVKFMKTRKIIMCIIAVILVIAIMFLFVNVFAFEDDPVENTPTATTPEITEDLINQLYSYIPENEMGLHTMYTGYYNTINNISNDIILSMIYEYLLEFDEFSLEATSLDELTINNVLLSNDNINDLKPLYKISVDVVNETFPKIFGESQTFKIANFRYNYNTLGRLDSTNSYFYIFNNTPLETNKNDIVFRGITKYAVTNNNETIEIYDYYLKCDLNTNNCYNDEEKKLLNNNIKYTDNFDINNYLDKTVTYKHTYKFEHDYYYWFSSDLA